MLEFRPGVLCSVQPSNRFMTTYPGLKALERCELEGSRSGLRQLVWSSGVLVLGAFRTGLKCLHES